MAKGKKRGGPRRKPGPREPNGKPQRNAVEQAREARSVGVEARMRVYSMVRQEAEKPESGYALGRYLLSGAISPQQALAGEEYERVCRRYDKAMDAKRVRSASDYDGGPGHDNDDGTDPEFVAACRRAETDFAASIAALRMAHSFAEKLLNTIQHGVWIAPGGVMFPAIVAGLDALVKLYRVEEWSKQGEAA